MGIKIKNITVKGLGPIDHFSHDLGIFNVIFSHNEKGKTFLTEFILRSLFKNLKRWKNIRKEGSGKIWVQGIDKDLFEFSPSSKNKLEDFLSESHFGLPPSIVNLLVVKGAEAAIVDDTGGINKHIIKEILSGLNILDQVDSDNNISKTVKSAYFQDGKIVIPKKGEGKEYEDILYELDQIEKIFNEIETSYSMGILETNKIQEGVLTEKLDNLTKAKKHEAYLLSKKIEERSIELDRYPEDIINQLDKDIHLFRTEEKTLEKLQKSVEEVKDNCKHLNWLTAALDNYKQLMIERIHPPKRFYLYTSGIFFTGTIVSIILSRFVLSLSFLGIALLFIAIFIYKSINSVRYYGQNEELIKIKEEFKKKTGKELTEIATLEKEKREQQESATKLDLLQEQMNSKEKEIDGLELRITSEFKSIYSNDIAKNEWEKILGDIKEERKSLKSQVEIEEKKLNILGISESDYLVEKPSIKYSQADFQKNEQDLTDIREQIKNREKDLENLKYKICSVTKDDFTISWDNLIENLRNKRKEINSKLKYLTSNILAGIVVHEVLEKLREEEELKIQKGLNSRIVTQPLKDLTRRYNRYILEDEKICVADDYDTFDLENLSTGAKEQVMLALRMGFSQKLLNKDTLFLILDDAFQHSDWEKREILVEQLASIAQKDWQIIYLTMDNHIRRLFENYGKVFGKEFRNIEIQ